MGIKFHSFLLLCVCVIITSTLAQQDLFGVTKDGHFYKRYPPQTESDNWLGSATLIGYGDWKDFQHLFFNPDGTLYGVLNGKFYKGSPPTNANDNWLARAKLVGSGGWDVFQFLFFDPVGILYGVVDDKLYRRDPPKQCKDNWLGSASRVGAGGWSGFKFLFFNPQGILHAVFKDGPGDFISGSPFINENDNWPQSPQPPIGYNFNEYSLLFFMANGELYGVKGDEFFKFSSTVDISSSMERIGSGGWSGFKFLMAPLHHE